ncbi:hypothetical protein LEP1GSC192_0732 [Leptospira sp. B5-022]|nr:hypothetical protein LEP1GSC192_0732 [Leptospira sp. B5-022]
MGNHPCIESDFDPTELHGKFKPSYRMKSEWQANRFSP